MRKLLPVDASILAKLKRLGFDLAQHTEPYAKGSGRVYGIDTKIQTKTLTKDTTANTSAAMNAL
jgi:hypothetical protein